MKAAALVQAVSCPSCSRTYHVFLPRSQLWCVGPADRRHDAKLLWDGLSFFENPDAEKRPAAQRTRTEKEGERL